jgi:ABC-type Fe3+/spermidine/putrescine transport system ATPase subunit
MSALSIRSVRKSFGGSTVLDAVSAEIGSGEFVTLLGPSGCGKTTLLRIIAGLIMADGGRILMDDTDVTTVEAQRRGIGMVFQSHALFPHMTVLENVGFGLRMRGVPRRQRDRQASDALALVHLQDFGPRYPQQLSGGQQQRVAIARAAVFKPRLMLMDEPFGALDRKLREALQIELRRMTRELGITTIFVTHDQDEALVLSDRIALMQAGRLAQIGTPAEVFRQPRTRFAADFMGMENFFAAKVIGVNGDGCELACGAVRLASTQRFAAGAVTVGIRSEDIAIGDARAVNGTGGTIRDVVYRGNRWTISVGTPIGELICTAAHPPAIVGETVHLQWNADAVLVFPE